MTTAPGIDPPTVAADLADLARAHQAAWLAEVLPPGPCLVWGGDPELARTLAHDGRRTVALVAPDDRAREVAMRSTSPGVQVRTPASVTADRDFASLVARLEEPRLAIMSVLDHLLPLLAREAAIAVVTDPAAAEQAQGALAERGHVATLVPQAVSLASTLGHDGEPTVSLPRGEVCSTIVVAGADPPPSVRLGRDAGPARWWADLEQVRAGIERVDSELGEERTARIAHLEAERARLTSEVAALDQRLTDARSETDARQARIDELLSSTSWRVSAPLRWVSDALKRR